MNRLLLWILIVVAVAFAGVWLLHGGAAVFSPPKIPTLLKCSAADCGNEFTAELPVRFKDYPVKCPKCGQRTAFILQHCWKCDATYALDRQHPLQTCPKCGCALPQN
jgi:DNA-directed RNA polymerase subunit RPC12/RpoP